MTLADLFTTLEAHGVLPRAKDCKTALRLLAEALRAPSWEECQVDAACREDATWGQALDDHFQQLQTQGRTLSGGYRRNIRSHVRAVFRVAEAQGLLAAPLPPALPPKLPRLVFERQHRAASPYRSIYAHTRHCYRLPQAEWPPDIQDGWRIYRAKCSLRETTWRGYVGHMRSYLGYLAHVAHAQPQWADVFDTVQLAEFVRWHAARHERPMTTYAYQMVTMVAAMAKVLKHPHARDLAEYRQTLPMPDPVHNKRVHDWVPLAELEAVAQACLREGRLPVARSGNVKTPGLNRARAFERGVILALLVRVPLRQRNVREMQWGKHLYQDHEGDWQLSFRGSDLKIGNRGERINEYTLNLSKYAPDFLPVLEEWRTVYSPRLPNPAGATLVFPTGSGAPYTTSHLGGELSSIVARYTGKRFYPHLIRTIWATEFLTKTQDYATAATMLGDTVAMVIKTYYHIVHEEQHAKAAAFLAEALKAHAA